MNNPNSKKYKGIIFDFNGTLLWDTQLHNRAWDIFWDKHKIILHDDEKNKVIHGKTNEIILKIIFSDELSAKEIFELSEEKESIYRKLLDDSKLELADGAIELFEYCNNKKIKIVIATSSGKSNVEYYIEKYNLLNWFNKEYIIYDDGKLKSKPNPEIYLAAINKMQLNKEDIIIFEDSISGINAALNSEIGRVIIVDSNHNNFKFEDCEYINSFIEFDTINLV